jgi:hypothetical protein
MPESTSPTRVPPSTIFHLEIEILQTDHLKAFPINRANPKSPNPTANAASIFRRLALPANFLPSIMHSDPAAPINLMEEPVHYYQEDNDREQSGPGLQIESRNVERDCSRFRQR